VCTRPHDARSVRGERERLPGDDPDPDGGAEHPPCAGGE